MLEIAEQDLKSSIVLFNNELYAQAIFFQQQAVEKICKYLAHKYKSGNSFSGKSVGHDSLKIFLIVLEDQNDEMAGDNSFILKLRELFENDTDKYKTNFSSFKDDFQNFRKRDLLNLKKSEINDILTLLNKHIDKPVIPEELVMMKNLTFDQFLDLLNQSGMANNLELNKLKELFEIESLKNKIVQKFEAVIESSELYASAAYIAFMLAVAFTKHAVQSRYPSETTNELPSELYNINHPLVRYLPLFHEFTKLSIIRLQKSELLIESVRI